MGKISENTFLRFKWVEEISQFNEDCIKSYHEDSDIGCLLKVDVQYPLELHKLHSDLPFLSEIMKIEMVEKLLAWLRNEKTIYFVHIRNLKQAFNHGLLIKKSAQNY